MLVGSSLASLYVGSNRIKAVRQGSALRYFRPDSIPGLAAWWDASDASTLTLNGAKVSAVADKSGNGNTLLQANAAAQPDYTANLTNSLSGFTVTGGTDYMTGSIAGFQSFTGLTVFCVGKPSLAAAPDVNSVAWFAWGNGGNGSGPYPGNKVVLYSGGTGLLSGETQSFSVEKVAPGGRVGSNLYARPAATVTLETVLLGNGGTKVYQYGGQVTQNLFYNAAISDDYSPASVGYTVDNDVHIAAMRTNGSVLKLPLTGDVGYGETLVFDSQLSEADRQLVEGYLAWKWGLQAKLPYDHPYAPQAIGGSSQRVPVDSDVLAFSAASGTKSIPDLNKIEDLVTYLKAQSLWNYARFYPMKSAQNAGSGSTVYGLGGLTSNNMTLVNSPTWGSSGVTFASASSQCGRIADFLGGGTLAAFWRGSNSNNDCPMIAQYDYGAAQRAFSLGRSATGPATIRRSETGVAAEVYDDADPFPAGEVTLSAYWIEGGGRSLWQDKTEKSLSSTTAEIPSRRNASVDVTVGAYLNAGTPAYFASGTFVFAGVIEAAITTTQRETITDLINAL